MSTEVIDGNSIYGMRERIIAGLTARGLRAGMNNLGQPDRIRVVIRRAILDRVIITYWYRGGPFHQVSITVRDVLEDPDLAAERAAATISMKLRLLGELGARWGATL